MSFRTLPRTAEQSWSSRVATTSTEPSSTGLVDTIYASPIQSVTISAEFLPVELIKTLPYAIDNEGFNNEWDYAVEEWEKLNEKVTAAIKEYNQSLIKRSREYSLNSTEILGNGKVTMKNDIPELIAPTIQTIESNSGSVVIGSGNKVQSGGETRSRRRGWVRTPVRRNN